MSRVSVTGESQLLFETCRTKNPRDWILDTGESQMEKMEFEELSSTSILSYSCLNKLSHIFCNLAECLKLSFLLQLTSTSSWLSSQLSLSPYWLQYSIFIVPLSFSSLPETLTIGQLVMESWDSDCPNCDPSGSIAGLIGAQFCAACHTVWLNGNNSPRNN
ncbi:hypothetical protein FOBRF1_009599 [Fusarium oxysporum]